MSWFHLFPSSDADDFEPPAAKAAAGDDKWAGEDEDEEIRVSSLNIFYLFKTEMSFQVLVMNKYCLCDVNTGFSFDWIVSL